MRQLLLLRHAKSSWDDPLLSDHSRPLNARGHRAAAAMAAAMRELGLEPDVVLLSSSRRTLQTFQALELEGGPLVEPTDRLYLADWSQILAVLRDAPETARSIMVIGHNPGLHELALHLAGLPVDGAAPVLPTAHRHSQAQQRLIEGYPTAALTEFAIAPPWRTLGTAQQQGETRLIRFLCPRDLPSAQDSGLIA